MNAKAKEIEKVAIKLQAQLRALSPMVPSGFIYAGYRKTETELRQIVNDVIVCVRELAINQTEEK